MEQEWEFFGSIQLAILNLFNNKTPLKLKDISPYHSVDERVREVFAAREALKTNKTSVSDDFFSKLRSTIEGL